MITYIGSFRMSTDCLRRFKALAGLVKETKDSTRNAVQTLCKI